MNTNAPQTILYSRKERTTSNSFYEASITLLPQPEKDTRKVQTYYFHVHRHKKNPQKIFVSEIQQHIKKIICYY
jgi:hypothetical protein